jgi:putative tricarboxylic transport membrane protein
VKDVFRNWSIFLRSALTGVTIGLIPGVGGVTANFVAYFQASQSSDDDSFGTGDVRGVIASESSNDAKDGGAYVPTLAFGIPGSASMAILLGAFVIHGIVPGPSILQSNLDLVFIVIIGALVANLMSSAVGIAATDVIVKITRIDSNLFGPIILAWAFFAGFAVTNNVFDLAFVWLGGILGFWMMRMNMSRVPLILGMVLGPIIERTYWQALQISQSNHGIFLESIISKVLIFLVLITLFWPIVEPIAKRRMAQLTGGSS